MSVTEEDSTPASLVRDRPDHRRPRDSYRHCPYSMPTHAAHFLSPSRNHLPLFFPSSFFFFSFLSFYPISPPSFPFSFFFPSLFLFSFLRPLKYHLSSLFFRLIPLFSPPHLVFSPLQPPQHIPPQYSYFPLSPRLHEGYPSIPYDRIFSFLFLLLYCYYYLCPPVAGLFLLPFGFNLLDNTTTAVVPPPLPRNDQTPFRTSVVFSSPEPV